MKAFIAIAIILAVAYESNANTCSAHVSDLCMAPGSNWNSGACNSIFGGFSGNSKNLKLLASSHFQDSFKYLIMASYFNIDTVNRDGFNKLVQGYSDKMWNNGKKMMKYILKRGGKIDYDFKISNLNMPDYKGEVKVLATTLDMMKGLTENIFQSYKHSNNKVLHEGSRTRDSYDPAVSHFLEEEFIESYSEDINDLAGKLNVLGRMTRDEKTKAMGLHLFDKSL